ncbi:hypothetical protein LTR02_013906 [Friedmanniomyces endolithicus]|nr:hypothetical protein LTR94_011521 [Friedmanniomyces endolithicus]KAK0793327.1 hypothetical protein LTR59_008239 [Friedmanniomyces endolithicus]KAK0795715.1 hypothetical protein LTR38_008818 [Friedmanniomyces endolithicus]KAK0806760.1 hypothetical protein LTR75_006891 [Friedmanniomyces endolithicus]KAK0860876.1 hypothetical protein LTS02_008215 [Friedmanniomyces endolithicus]
MDPGFTSETSLSGTRPHTPPYTPYRNKGKRTRLTPRSDSPASIIHPTETVSPPKKHAAKRQATERDSVKVEELAESDPAYLSDDVSIVYPASLEEASGLSTANSEYGDDELSSSASDDLETRDVASDAAGTEITHRMSRLRCADEAEFEAGRMQRRLSKRMSLRVFKRSHSQSVKGPPEGMVEEVVDVEGMGDQDLEASARRLRRRVRGPEGGGAVGFEDVIPRRALDFGAGDGMPLTPEQEGKSERKARRGEAVEPVVDVDEMNSIALASLYSTLNWYGTIRRIDLPTTPITVAVPKADRLDWSIHTASSRVLQISTRMNRKRV